MIMHLSSYHYPVATSNFLPSHRLAQDQLPQSGRNIEPPPLILTAPPPGIEMLPAARHHNWPSNSPTAILWDALNRASSAAPVLGVE